MFKQPFKELFSFSSSERISILILAFLIMLVLILRIFFQPEENYGHHWEVDLLSIDEQLKADEPDTKFSRVKINTENLFAFDPNTLTDSQWRAIGLQDYQIRNITNYINRVGPFQSKEDFKSLYTLSTEEYALLEPYLSIPEPLYEESDFKTARTDKIPNVENNKKRMETMPPLEINTCTEDELQNLPGIGPVYSQRIKKYQTLLGGFVSIEQLSEVYGMDSMVIQKIIPLIYVDSSEIVKIDINEASYETLLRHPYLKRYDVESILTFRDFKRVENINQLLDEKILNEETFSKVKPYLR